MTAASTPISTKILQARCDSIGLFLNERAVANDAGRSRISGSQSRHLRLLVPPVLSLMARLKCDKNAAGWWTRWYRMRFRSRWWRPPHCMRFSLSKIAHAALIRSREWAFRGSRGTCSSLHQQPMRTLRPTPLKLIPKVLVIHIVVILHFLCLH